MNKKKMLIICIIIIAVVAIIIAVTVYNAVGVDQKIESVENSLKIEHDRLLIRGRLLADKSNPTKDEILEMADIIGEMRDIENELEVFERKAELYNNTKGDPSRAEENKEAKEWILNY